MERVYKGITFAEDYNKSFEDFKAELGSTHDFLAIPSAKREAELKKAYEIATGKTSVSKADGDSVKPATKK